MSDAYQKLLSEVRKDLGKGAAESVDWEAVDAKLFARIEQERRAERARFSPPGRRGLVLASVGLVAAAAIVAVLAGKTRDPLDAEQGVAIDGAGTVVAIEGAGPVLLDGKPVRTGAALALGDVLETRGAQATVERSGKVTLTLEPGTRAVVTHVRGALVLSLEQGAIEAQVVPVGAGEAFAIDVEGSRVAVHGTHLRVARSGDRVAVDLNEGVVSVGEAPRAGSLLGTLVNAPAHVEFAAADPVGTLVQTHDPGAVRAPQVLRPAASAAHALGAAARVAPCRVDRDALGGAGGRDALRSAPAARHQGQARGLGARSDPAGRHRERCARLHGRATAPRKRHRRREHGAPPRAERRRNRALRALRPAGGARRERVRGPGDLPRALRARRPGDRRHRLHQLTKRSPERPRRRREDWGGPLSVKSRRGRGGAEKIRLGPSR